MKQLFLARPFWLAVALGLFGRTSCLALVNGGFEVPPLALGAFVTIPPGSEPAGFGWSVTFGNVDVGHIPNPFVDFPAFEGLNGLDLNGTVRGGVAQDFATTPGQVYNLSLVYSDNPSEAGISSASIIVTDVVSASSLLSDSISHSTATNGTGATGDGNADGVTYSNSFMAIGATTRLSLASTSASNTPSGGILIDAVDISGVNSLAGDYNLNGVVDAADYVVWRESINTQNSFNIWRANFGRTAGNGVAFLASVPEPQSGLFVILAAVIGTCRVRRITSQVSVR